MDCVRRIRKELGWSQERTAAEAGIDRVTLVHIENGKSSPTVDTLQKLATAMRVEVADFFPKAQSTLFSTPDAPVGQESAGFAGEGDARRVLDSWTETVRLRADEALFGWRCEAADLRRPEHLASALTLHRTVRAEARGFFREILELMRALDREVPVEAPERKAELASLATALKQASDAVWNRKQTLIEELEAQRRSDIEEIREIVKMEFGVDLEVEQEGDRLEAEKAEATLSRIEDLRVRRAG
jgi:transcriptional regulator with XRE-family HTH domain